MIEAAKAVESNTTPVAAGIAGGTTQLVKPRPPPLWSGQKFDRWKAEVNSWCNNGRGNDEEKFLDLIESLKKNDAIKRFVKRTLIEKVGTTMTIDHQMKINILIY